MEEAKKIFPGHTISHVLSLFSTFVLVGIIFIFFGGGDVFDISHFLPRTELFEGDGKYFLVVTLATIAALSYQHKAVFTKKTDDDKVHFWKQITPISYTEEESLTSGFILLGKKKEKKDNIVTITNSGHRSHIHPYNYNSHCIPVRKQEEIFRYSPKVNTIYQEGQPCRLLS